MQYRVTHSTKYSYSSPVPLSHNQLRLNLRTTEYQIAQPAFITILPEPTMRRGWTDCFGNATEFFSVEQSHRAMTVLSESTVERNKPVYDSLPQISWEEVARQIAIPMNIDDRIASQFRFDSRYAKRFDQALAYVRPSFVKGISVVDAVKELTRRIYTEFEYDPQATQVSTPATEVLSGKRGVCQDFAHLQISCLRSIGLAARYVSGYLLTVAPPGKEKLIGNDASHAWISVYVGNGKWVDFDPTNNCIPGEEHITIGWGRDYSDVCPIQGVLIGGGQTVLLVSVDVRPVGNSMKVK